MIFRLSILSLLLVSLPLLAANADQLLVEAESFDNHGGWKLDTQFIDEMGSPYLLAHGLGQPVQSATKKVTFAEPGIYRVLVRTKDWVARWSAPGSPGKFQLLVNGTPLETTFGTQGANWFWHEGGTIEVKDTNVTLELKDLTGFDGRCDAIFFTKSLTGTPPNSGNALASWRKETLGLSQETEIKDGYDLVVIGGGYSGMGAALSAARMGCKVALIQNRPVLGGNGSSEVRVWAKGLIRRGKYPRIGEIIDEFVDHAKKSPGTYEEFGDKLKEAIVRAEPNIDLFLNHHVNQVEMNGSLIASVSAFDTKTSEVRKFVGNQYVDCTGHGTIGALAGALYDMTPKGRMGMSNMWAWGEDADAPKYPETPWALDLDMKDFPYPRDHHGQWFWESGFDKDALNDAEGIRDHNLRAVYGAFNAMKNRDGADKHQNAQLTWLAFIGGPRESRRLMGDVLLTQDDIVAKKEFKDGCVPSTWSIDLHYPKEQYAEKFSENPFISYAVHDRRVDRAFGYAVPYRCFYSKNINNLFMAGRCISVTHQALGTVRVMQTCGMMGEVVGKAASLCSLHQCQPREVYTDHWDEMVELLKLTGQARRLTVNSPIVMPKVFPPAGSLGPPSGVNPAKLKGIIIDDRQAEKVGKWPEGQGLPGYIAYGYLYSSAKDAEVRFPLKVKEAGKYEIRYAYGNHPNRGDQVSVTVKTASDTKELKINMKEKPPIDGSFISLGIFELQPDQTGQVILSTNGAGGNAHADAIQLLLVN